ncbi:ROK family protein [Prosthecomicrobium pneumaticum]|uniref:Glucokinase n=1 Tax=Prosthecomicrobium pneumaticum TaxID=81895 RepID=A0A7W9FJF0_9HYPH|nr:ROK family protein [Prosthecomicrobium pneumaticum]MBB5751647.1 glucokinase [Prosthecomicrobium pneumaticum]
MAPGRSAIGVDIGGTHIRAARVSEAGAILAITRTASARDPERALDAVIAAIRAVDADDAAAIGIGVPGRVDAATGAVLSGGYVDLSGVALRARIEALFGRPVAIDNDCGMALVAEAAVGAARGLRNVVMLTIGTGIGGALMEGGRLLRGRRTAGQLGHLVVETEGRPCVCGKRGCVETTSSGTALGRLIAGAGLAAGTTAAELRRRAEAGDPAATGVLRAWALPLRAAIDSLAAALDPDIVLLGGGLGAEAAAAVAALPAQPSWYPCRIAAAALGDEAGVIGAAHAALDRSAPLAAGSPPAAIGRSASAAAGSPPAAIPARAAGATAPRPKRAVLVNGVPASGKSGVARALAERTGWPVLALDVIKNPFLERIEGVDRPFNRLLGQASYAAIFATIGAAPPGSTFIVDAWFGFQPEAVLDAHIATAGLDQVAEIWCHAPPDTVAERYRSRAAARLPGHPGAAYADELRLLAARATPLGRGPLIAVDTTTPLDAGRLADWLTEMGF